MAMGTFVVPTSNWLMNQANTEDEVAPTDGDGRQKPRDWDPEDRGVAVHPGECSVPDLPRDFLRSDRVPRGWKAAVCRIVSTLSLDMRLRGSDSGHPRLRDQALPVSSRIRLIDEFRLATPRPLDDPRADESTNFPVRHTLHAVRAALARVAGLVLGSRLVGIARLRMWRASGNRSRMAGCPTAPPTNRGTPGRKVSAAVTDSGQ